jgi:hypothetical protein
MIDRCQNFWCEKYLLKKLIEPGKFGRKGLLLLVGGMKKEVGVNCGNSCATAFFRTVNVPEHKILSYLGIDEKGAILKHPTALKDASCHSALDAESRVFRVPGCRLAGRHDKTRGVIPKCCIPPSIARMPLRYHSPYFF